MNKAHFDPIAELVHDCYSWTSTQAEELQQQSPGPFPSRPNAAVITHLFRWRLQEEIKESTQFELDAKYVESGRVAFDYSEHEMFLVFRSYSNFFKRDLAAQASLFDAGHYVAHASKRFLLHRFGKDGLTLWLANASQVGSTKLVPVGEPRVVGVWPFPFGPCGGDDGGASVRSFDQGPSGNPFDFLGDIRDEEEFGS